MSNALKNYADGWSEEDVKAEVAATEQEKSDESEFLALAPDTEEVLRAMPSATGGNPFLKFAKHFYQDPATSKWVSFACPAKSKLDGFQNFDCPVCEQAARLKKSRVKADRDFGFKMKAKWKALINMYVRPADADVQAALDDGLPEPKGKMKVWEISSWSGKKNGKNMHERMLALRQNRRVGGNYVDPTAQGFDLLLQRSGEGQSTRYEIHALLAERKPLHPDPAMATKLIEEEQHDLAWYATPPTFEELQQILQGESRGKAKAAVEAAGGSTQQALSGATTSTAGDAIDVEATERGGKTDGGF